MIFLKRVRIECRERSSRRDSFDFWCNRKFWLCGYSSGSRLRRTSHRHRTEREDAPSSDRHLRSTSKFRRIFVDLHEGGAYGGSGYVGRGRSTTAICLGYEKLCHYYSGCTNLTQCTGNSSKFEKR